MKNYLIFALSFFTLLTACKSDDAGCDFGFEGDDCETEVNKKFVGDYNTTYTGTGALAGSNGTTVARVTEGDNPYQVEINVQLDLSASVVGQDVDLPLDVTIQGYVDGDTYEIPQTNITTSVDVGGFPITIDLGFDVVGTLNGDELDSKLTMTGTIQGTVDMEGEK